MFSDEGFSEGSYEVDLLKLLLLNCTPHVLLHLSRKSLIEDLQQRRKNLKYRMAWFIRRVVEEKGDSVQSCA